jgi:PE family
MALQCLIMAGDAGPAMTVAGLRVTPETVLGVAQVVMEEVNRLRQSMWRFQFAHQGMPELGSDPVSKAAAPAFTEATTRLVRRCQSSIDELAKVGDELTQAARAYGKSEDEIKATFDAATKVAYSASPVPPSPVDLPAPLRSLFDSVTPEPGLVGTTEGLRRGGFQ